MKITIELTKDEVREAEEAFGVAPLVASSLMNACGLKPKDTENCIDMQTVENKEVTVRMVDIISESVDLVIGFDNGILKSQRDCDFIRPDGSGVIELELGTIVE